MTTAPVCGGGAAGSDLSARTLAARAFLRGVWPEAQEASGEGRRGPIFLYAADALRFAPFRLIVDPPNLFLHFSDGAALPDPAGLLRGEGRRGRYLCLRDAGMLADPAVLALIAAATGREEAR